MYTINIKKNRCVINLLGEVCWGFTVDNFEKKIGVKLEVAESLLDRLLKEEKLGIVETCLNDSEIQIIKKTLIEVEKEIEEWEFHTRLGITLEEVKKMEIFQ